MSTQDKSLTSERIDSIVHARFGGDFQGAAELLALIETEKQEAYKAGANSIKGTFEEAYRQGQIDENRMYYHGLQNAGLHSPLYVELGTFTNRIKALDTRAKGDES